MENFEYARPKTLAKAVELLGTNPKEAELLAGGTDLLARMKDYISSPRRVVSLKGIPELGGIRAESGGTVIGALTTIEQVAEDSTIGKDFPTLSRAAKTVAGPQIRTMATIGGNLCQRPRCWYYHSGFGLLAQDSTGKSLVPNGENRYHAILGNEGPAYYVHPSSLAPALIALEARVRVHGPKGMREVALADFYVTPKNENERENVLQPNEIVSEVWLPSSERGARGSFYEISHRHEMEWPFASAAVKLRLDGGRVSHARIVLGHVAPVPWPAPAAEKAIVGQAVTSETAWKAGEAATMGARPLSQNGYKVQLVKVAVQRALLAAAGKEA
jgi:xanthine dehydrogenase YagS FAD-binding subunit